MVMTLCYKCADVISEDKTQTINRLDDDQKIKEPCFMCRKPGFDYIVSDKENTNGKGLGKEIL